MEEGKKQGYDAHIKDLEGFTPEVLKEAPLNIFLMATYGEGEPTDNAAEFYKWLKNVHAGKDETYDKSYFENYRFCVFGLGNTQYEHYNKMGKMVDKWIGEMDGARVYELGLGDDDGTLESDFYAWKEKLWESIGNGASIVKSDKDEEITHYYELRAPKSGETININSAASSTKYFFNSPLIKIIEKRELRNNANNPDAGSTLHVEFDIGSSNLQWQTADNFAILSENNKDIVEALAKKMNWDLNEVVIMDPVDDDFKYPFPTPASIGDILRKYIDIQGQLKMSTGNSLLSFVTPKDKETVKNLLKPANLKKESEDNFISVASLIDSYDFKPIPFVDFLHVVPTLQPRYYTISSSSIHDPNVCALTVSLTTRKLNNSKIFNGVCTNYLNTLNIGDSLRGFIRPSTFRLPESTETPIVMIGPGTGIAPMRAFLQERKHLKNILGKTLGESILFFGCRNRNIDSIYANELEEYVVDGVLNSLQIAYSREPNQKKVYVQDLILNEENSSKLASLVLDQNASIYVCGATLMGSQVQEALAQGISKAKNMSQDAVSKILKQKQDEGKYIQELWSA